MTVARLYRGPLDGRIRAVPDHENLVTVFVTRYPRHNVTDGRKIARMDLSHGMPATFSSSAEMYTYRKTGHTHPDGSVYFEWTMPKGTKWRNK